MIMYRLSVPEYMRLVFVCEIRFLLNLRNTRYADSILNLFVKSQMNRLLDLRIIIDYQYISYLCLYNKVQ